VPVALAVAGIIAPLGALVALPFAAAAVGVGLARRRRAAVASRRPPPDPNADLVRQVEAIDAQIQGKVPSMVEARVDRVTGIVREIIPRMAQLGVGSAQAHAVVSTATTYLPEALGSYLRLPRSYADSRPVSNGKTSLMVLCDQLDLLGAKMDEVFDAVCRADADALIAHGRFLAEKFGSGALALDPNQR
jgi:hypothetical protein